VASIFDKLTQIHAEKRKEIEAYFEQRRSDKVEEALNDFYIDNFLDEPPDHTNTGTVVRPQRTLNPNLERTIPTIKTEAKNLGIPAVEVAGFVLDHLLYDAYEELLILDKKIIKGDEESGARRIMKEAERLLKEEAGETDIRPSGKLFVDAERKMVACEAIVEMYPLGDDAVNLVERNLKRIERRKRLVKVMGEADSREEVFDAYKELQEMIESQDLGILKGGRMMKGEKDNEVPEYAALIDEQVGMWKSDGS
jgi:hypothetical protein